MDQVLGTLVLRPYVFAFLVAFLVAGARDLGRRRTVGFWLGVWALAWVAEYSSTRTGVPFGLYHYTGVTRGREIYLANVPFMDPVSFAFLAYASFCLARMALGRRRQSGAAVAVLSGALMMALDVVIDPLAVRGDRWFLGHIFYYPHGGAYFGVPLTNFAGWFLVGTLGVGGYVLVTGRVAGGRPGAGVALYYAVIAFNLVVTAWIGEGLLAFVGLVLHGLIAMSLRYLKVRTGGELHLDARGVQSA